MILKRIYMLMGAGLIAVSALAAPIDEAKRMYRDGDYSGAVAQLRKILKSKPKDGTANYYLGASLMALGETGEARGPLEKAEERGVADASRLLVVNALDEYRPDDAAEHIDTWQGILKKARKSEPAELGALQARTVQLRNMLERVEKIEILYSR